MAKDGEIKVGDRVRVSERYQGQSGETGTVTSIRDSVWPIIVEADGRVDGVKIGRFYPDELDILDENYPNEVPD